jgi:hypothetical protein
MNAAIAATFALRIATSIIEYGLTFEQLRLYYHMSYTSGTFSRLDCYYING